MILMQFPLTILVFKIFFYVNKNNFFLDIPPQSMKSVKKNLSLIEKILNAFNTIQNEKKNFNNNIMINKLINQDDKYLQIELEKLIENLKEEIYPVLQDFKIKAKTVIWEQFKIEENIPFDLSTAKSLLKLTKDYMDENLFQSIDKLIGQIIYVDEMERLENSLQKSETKDIVPVTGLIIGRFKRYFLFFFKINNISKIRK